MSSIKDGGKQKVFSLDLKEVRVGLNLQFSGSMLVLKNWALLLHVQFWLQGLKQTWTWRHQRFWIFWNHSVFYSFSVMIQFAFWPNQLKKTSNKADRHAVMWTFNGVSSRRIDVNWLWPSCHKSLIYSGCNFSCCPGTVYMSHEPVLISEMSLPFRLQCERRGEILLLGRNDVLWGKLHDSVQFVHLHLIYMTTECNFYHQESLKVRDHGSYCLRRYSGRSCLYMYANPITRINVSKVSFCRS